jgi:tryptophan halogenase
MNKKNVLIVGGGAAGWMTAAYLNAVLNRGRRDVASVSLLESAMSESPVTGEATIPEFSHFLAVLGIDKLQFMRRVGGTLRQSSKFVNWLNNSGEHFYHTFSAQRPGSVDMSAQRWLKSNRSVPFAETFSAQPQLSEMNLAPLMMGRWDFGAPLPYAFHVDVSRLTDLLREVAIAAGVKHHGGQISSTELSVSGDIVAVHRDNGERIEADLFIDCSGSEALLIGRELGTDWVDCSEWLICDSELSMDVPYETFYPGYVRPYTKVTAASAGWIRDIPLLDARSLSFTYCSDFLDDEGAERELRVAEGPHAESLGSEMRRFQTGRRKNAWVRNCISIGDASSCIESLEPTSIYMIEHAAAMLAEHFPRGDELTQLAFRYNRIMCNRFYELLDFANLHYCLTRRRDSAFWCEVQRPERVNDRLQAKLAFWRVKRPTTADFEDQFFPGQSFEPLASGAIHGDYRGPIDTAGLWDEQNYECVLYGMDFLDHECDEWFGAERPDSQVAKGVQERLKIAPLKLPTHAQWLQRFCGMPDYDVAPGANS